jgi:hypothetical protein
MPLCAKRQVVLPADICRQMALQPGSGEEISLAQDGSGIFIRPAATAPRKPDSVLFGRVVHRGTPVSIEQAQGLAVAKHLLRRGAR